jgi:hypothetical protein
MTGHDVGWTVSRQTTLSDPIYRYRPGCTCGWEGRACDTEDEAVEQINQHIADIKEQIS